MTGCHQRTSHKTTRNTYQDINGVHSRLQKQLHTNKTEHQPGHEHGSQRMPLKLRDRLSQVMKIIANCLKFFLGLIRDYQNW